MNIILGGTHGLGAEIAKLLNDTFVIGRSYDETVHGQGMVADLSKPEDISRIIDAISSSGITGFYWVAGYGYVGDFADQPDVVKMGQINFTNVLPVAQVVWQKLSKVDNSKFVVVSSTTGMKARANEAVYAATKHAQVGFTRSLGLEAERLGSPIKVALFLPGGMQTPFWDDGRPDIYEDFLDPSKVATEIVKDVSDQRVAYFERTIARGSL